MIGIVDYGLGNVRAIANIYKRLNIPARLVSEAANIAEVDRLILPGVGSFDWAMQCISRAGIRSALDTQVLEKRKPVLGICVGMQIMTERSEEGIERGLGWLPADVKRFNIATSPSLMLPHMGWNDVTSTSNSPLFAELELPSRFYFLHSYYVAPHRTDLTIAVSDYGGAFACAVGMENIIGVQFHPEKSHGWGICLLKTFAEAPLC